MKKSLIALLGLPMLLTAVAGCNSSSNGPKEEEREYICDMLQSVTPYVIVVPREASETEKFAANELSTLFAETTGRLLSINYDTGVSLSSGSTYISIGNTSLYNKAVELHGDIELSKNALNTDGFTIFTYGTNVIINAFEDRGKLYGVYEFIESTLGVKFLNYRYTHIPTLDKVELYSYDKVYVPYFQQRAFLNTAVYNRDQDYVAHMRFNTDYCPMDSKYGGSIGWANFGGNPAHTMSVIIPIGDYVTDGKDINGNTLIQEEYREVFAHRGSGETLVNFWANPTLIDYCFTNGVADDGSYDGTNPINTVAMTVEVFKRIILENPHVENFMLGQHDTPSGCPCEKCSAVAEKYSGGGKQVRFTNLVTKMVKDWMKEEGIDRDIYVTMFAYLYTIDAPINEKGEAVDETVIPREDVYVKYAPIRASYYWAPNDPRQPNDDSLKTWEDWSKITNRFHAWTYHTWYSNSLWFYPTMYALKPTMQMLHDGGVIYEFAQGAYYEYNIYQEDLNAYLFSKLCWDINLDVAELIEEYNYYYFGESAAPFVNDFIDKISNAYAYMSATGCDMVTRGNSKGIADVNYWPFQTIDALCRDFDDAIEAISNNANYSEKEIATFIENVERASITPKWMRLYLSDNYSGITKEDIGEMAKEWCDLGDKYGVRKYGEPADATFASIKEKYSIL